jgi:hypothetical protein
MRIRKAHARRGRLVVAALLACGATLAAVLGSGAAGTARSADAFPVIAAAGDIACDPHDPQFNAGRGSTFACRELYTARLLHHSLAAVLPLGDDQYSDGRLWKFRASYHPSWGRMRAISRPVPGNHEYSIPRASGYFNYYNGPDRIGPAGRRGDGFYSYDVGTWHLIALNSNCGEVSCAPGSRQLNWLNQDLADHATSQCVLAYWHHPWFQSGRATTFKPRTRPFWVALYAAHADVILNGHLHVYERFTPQDPDGHRDFANGIREFIVGTGGRNHERFGTTARNSQVRDSRDYGVLKLVLKPDRYRWRFITEDHRTRDHGRGVCH